MPKYWLASKTAPTPPVLDWLKWNLERHIAESGTIGTIIGINIMGDLQTIYSPVVIPNAFSSGNAAIIGNISDVHTEPAFVYTDASDIGSIMTVATYDNIPSDLHLEEHLSPRILAETSWASAKVKLGVVYLPMFAPIFFLGRRPSNHLCTTLTLRISSEQSLPPIFNGLNSLRSV
jgi:hypothetical protein